MTDVAPTAAEVDEGARLRRHVGEVLEEARGDRPRSEVVTKLGWRSKVNLLTIESGKDNVTLDRLAKVATALGGRLRVTFEPFE